MKKTDSTNGMISGKKDESYISLHNYASNLNNSSMIRRISPERNESIITEKRSDGSFALDSISRIKNNSV